MNDFLSFITPIIRAKGYTIESFCKGLEINRQSFYRQIKKRPLPFTPELLTRISSFLSLSPQQIEELYFYTTPQEKSAKHSDETVFLLNSILTATSSLSPYIYNKSSDTIIDFTLYQNSRSLINMPANDIALEIIKSISLDSADSNDKIVHNYTVTIYNCLEEETVNPYSSTNMCITKCGSLARLFYSLEKHSNTLNSTGNIIVSHYIPQFNLSQKDSIYLFRNLLPLLSTVQNYSYDTNELPDSLWSSHNNMCVIKYSQMYQNKPETKKHKYFIINFNNRGFGFVRCLNPYPGEEIEVQSIYHYFTHDSRNTICENRQTLHGVEALNSLYLYLHSQYKHLVLSSDFCFDTFPTSIWVSYKNRLSHDQKLLFAKLITSNFNELPTDSNTIIDNTLEVFAKRYETNINNNTICVYSEYGLSELIKNRMIHDLYYPLKDNNIPIPLFSKDELKDLLDNLLQQLQNKEEKGIHAYILTGNYRENAHNFLIYKDYGIETFTPYNERLSMTSNMYECKTTSTALYDYITDLIKQRNSSEITTFNPVKSDSSAITFVKNLIKRLNSY